MNFLRQEVAVCTWISLTFLGYSVRPFVLSYEGKFPFRNTFSDVVFNKYQMLLTENNLNKI